MTKFFTVSELKAVVKPYDPIDVLDSLLDMELIKSYYWNYENGVVEIDIPKDVEIKEIMDNIQEFQDSFQRNTKGRTQ